MREGRVELNFSAIGRDFRNLWYASIALRPGCIRTISGPLALGEFSIWSRRGTLAEHLKGNAYLSALDGTTVEQLGPNSKQHRATKYKKRQGETAPYVNSAELRNQRSEVQILSGAPP